MSILIDKKTRLLVQGITGNEGLFHTQQMLSYGTNVVAGVTPGKGGEWVLDGKVPVFDSVRIAQEATGVNTSVIFVPARFAADAIYEAADAGIPLIVCITEGIPTRDVIIAKKFVDKHNVTLVGPNCPGIITADEAKVGIMPGFVFKKGKVGLISKSGTLTYEMANQVVLAGLGISTAIGIGGDPIIGSTIIDLLKLFEKDKETEAIVIIGEIGGDMEIQAAEYIKENITKPVVAFIAGRTAPKGKRMGHAGAIIAGSKGTAQEKMDALAKAGVTVVDSPADIGVKVRDVLNK